MKTGRIVHLLGFELKRLKWLIIMAWLSLALAFVPRLMGAIGLWSSEWHDAEEFIAGTGTLLFGIAGLFIAIWSGLFGIKLIPTRPIRGSEVLAIRVSVLFGVLVIPVLLLTLVSLWLHGFSGEIILRNVIFTALAIIPVWLGVAFLARFAGSIKMTIAGFGILGIAVAMADSNQIRGLAEPWGNVVGSWLSLRYIAASWVTTFLLSASFWLIKNNNLGKRMTVAILCFIAGWLTTPRARKAELSALYRTQLSEAVAWTGQSKVWKTKDGTSVEFSYDNRMSEPSRFVSWQVYGGFVGGNGLRAKNPNRFWLDPTLGIEKIGLKDASLSLLKEGVIYSGNQGSKQFIAAPEDRQFGLSNVEFQLPKEMTISEDPNLSGTLAGIVYEIEELIDIPMGTRGEFQCEDLFGEIHGLSPDSEPGNPAVSLTIKSPLMDRYGYDGSRSSLLANLIFHLNYPEAGVVVEGYDRSGPTDQRLGGVQGKMAQIIFHSSRVLDRGEMWEETPQLKVYRIKVINTGYCHTKMPEFTEQPDKRGSHYYLSLLEGQGQVFETPSPQVLQLRPDPKTASRAEVGAWLREIRRRYAYHAAGRDLTDYADHWADLLIESSRKGYNLNDGPLTAAFVAGASEKWRGDLVSALGEVSWAPEALVERGWAESSRLKVTSLLEAGNRDPDVLKLAALLKIPGVEKLLLEKLVTSDDRALYELTRSLPNIGQAFDEALDKRLALLDRHSQSKWPFDQRYISFNTEPWSTLLLQGRTKDLEKFMEWLDRYYQAGRSAAFGYQGLMPFVENSDLKHLLKTKNMKARYFQWDFSIRRWVVNTKEISK